jgi:hypothetical protein
MLYKRVHSSENGDLLTKRTKLRLLHGGQSIPTAVSQDGRNKHPVLLPSQLEIMSFPHKVLPPSNIHFFNIEVLEKPTQLIEFSLSPLFFSCSLTLFSTSIKSRGPFSSLVTVQFNSTRSVVIHAAFLPG